MMVSGGYPEKYEKGKEVTIDKLDPKTLVFHAGTNIKNNKTVTSGGRVIAVTSYGKNLETALKGSYSSIEKVQFENNYYRKDIGKDVTTKS
jgi:phosphoribosylamine--glycine ligase